jgi:hypothetical protein
MCAAQTVFLDSLFGSTEFHPGILQLLRFEFFIKKHQGKVFFCSQKLLKIFPCEKRGKLHKAIELNLVSSQLQSHIFLFSG